VIEDALREGTAGGGGAESLGETEGFCDGEMSLQVDERGSGDGLLTDDDTTTGGEAVVDTTNTVLGALDLDKEDRLLESGLGGELGSVEHTSGGGDDLTATSVDSISVEGNILDVESASSHVLLSHDTLLGGPLEGSLDGVLDFIEVLDGLSHINEKVGSGGLWSEAPDLLGIIFVPFVFILENLSSRLHVLLASNYFILDGLGKLITNWCTRAVESVMLVG